MYVIIGFDPIIPFAICTFFPSRFGRQDSGVFSFFEKSYLIQVFSKNEKSNLSDAEKNAVRKVIAVLKSEAAKKQGAVE